MQNTPGKSATFGSILIILGTSVGAGMLALPMSSAELSFTATLIILTIAWLVMTATGLLMLEINITLPQHRNHFDSMAGMTLGVAGRMVAWISSACLFYSLIAAYISGNAALFLRALALIGIHLPAYSSAILFTLVIAGIVFFSTRGVDLLNRGLMSFKGLALIIAFIGLMPHVDITHLHLATTSFKSFAAICAAAPIFLVGFGYHAVLPSLVNYLGPNINRLRKIVWCGTTLAFVIYVLWLIISFGVLPQSGAFSLHMLHANGNKVANFLSDIESMVPINWVRWSVNAFSDVAMATSCLGVSLGMFDFLADALKRKNNSAGRAQSLAITLLPPLVVAIALPNFFVLGLNLGAIFLVILEIFLPVLIIWRFRIIKPHNTNYKVAGGNLLLIVLFIAGIAFLLADLFSRLR